MHDNQEYNVRYIAEYFYYTEQIQNKKVTGTVPYGNFNFDMLTLSVVTIWVMTVTVNRKQILGRVLITNWKNWF